MTDLTHDLTTGAPEATPDKINLQTFLKGSYRENKVFLNVGCGPKTTPVQFPIFQDTSWREVRLDIDPDLEPDVLASISDMSMIEDGTADAIYSCHNMEHLFYHEVAPALQEFLRILKPGGFICVIVPDIEAAARDIACNFKMEEGSYESPAGPIAPIDMLYSYRAFTASGNIFMTHKTGFTKYNMYQHLLRAGFKSGQVWDGNYNVYTLAYKGV